MELLKKTDEMFAIIETVNHRLEMIYASSYSEGMVSAYFTEIEELKSMFSQDVFEVLKYKYRTK